MTTIKSFYLSRILGSKVFLTDGKIIGKITDLIASNEEPPQVASCAVKNQDGTVRLLDWSYFSISKIHNKYQIYCTRDLKIVPPQNIIRLKKHILDKQIVDIDGKKVVRVNDIRLALISTGLYVVAVDVGLEGLLRRLGLVRPIRKVLQLFGKNISSKFILWSNMEAIGTPFVNLKLSTSSSKLNTLHPSELADIIEDLDVNTRTAIFSALDHDRAADVLEEMETEAKSSILDQLSVEKAADVLEKMPADEVADILDDLKEERAEELLQEMDKEASAEVRGLMEYPDNQVGSLMSTDYISFKEHMTVQQTIHELRRLKPESDTIYYLYVVDDEGKLTAIVSLRDLIVADPDIKLEEIMNRKIVYVYDQDNINSLVEIISKYSLLAVPVVSHENKMVGVVIIDDVVFEILKSKKRRL
ncbi:MAG TPA: magnesium transporter MgtE [Firmicutes bacterium]|jgi:magnesium transporter|nr:magnesium transporter MgtE [Bacillota bacterium]